MIRTIDGLPPVAPRGRNGHAACSRGPSPSASSPKPAPGPAGPSDPAPGPGPDVAPHRDRVSAVHDAIDFARALVADGGVQTAGLTMLRGEVQAVARELRAAREEYAALRADVDRMRWDVVRLGQFVHGPLVERLAAKFAGIDAAVSRLSGGAK